MKLCIPVSSPEGFDSVIEPHLPNAEHLVFFDTESRSFESVCLREQSAGGAENIQIDAVLCGSINRITLRTLVEQGIGVYGTEAATVGAAIAQYENGELVAVSAGAGSCGGQGQGCSSGEHACHGSGGQCAGNGHDHADANHHEHHRGHNAGGCCGGHGHGDETDGHGCQGGGCGGHADAEGGHAHGEGGCGCGGHAHAHRPDAQEIIGNLDAEQIRIAVSSQNRKTVTEHAGKSRKFWIYDVKRGQVVGKQLVELPIEQSFHATPVGQAHPLDAVDVLISGSMGSGLKQRLLERGIHGSVTTETDPDQAVAAFLSTVTGQSASPALL
jgi:predicted Fe-Mo cluster-binding NifX family protein